MKRKIWLWPVVVILLSYTSIEASNTGIGQDFIEQTKLGLLKATGSVSKFKSSPPMYKEYPMAPEITLPKPEYKGMALEEAITKRRSVRKYSNRPLTLAQLSQLLFAAQGVTGEYEGRLLRAAPSAGALYPLEIYLVINNVEGVKPGIYHYGVKKHVLEQIKVGDFSKQISTACLDQEAVGDAQVSIVITSMFDRVCYKYRERGYRYALIEVGHVGQNVYLEATSLGLGAVAMGAFYDDKMNKLLEIDGKSETAVYALAVGNK